MPVLLAVDDDPSILLALSHVFRNQDVQMLTAATASEGLVLVKRQRPDAILLDINLPDYSGLEAFRRIREIDAHIPVIFLTGSGKTETAIEAMKQGAYDYLLKDQMLRPDEIVRLQEVVAGAFQVSRMTRVPALVAPKNVPDGPADLLIGLCPAMQQIYKSIGRVAPQDVTVLVLGESGTGKELVARAIYHHSRRSAGPFLAINCAAIPETLLESELFGHEKGAFTGADRKRIGKFEQCTGGTLFLDEVGDMSALTQAKILRVLQEQRFERVGGNDTIQTNVRVITATHRDLPAMVAAGKFRSDLYYRLGVFTIALPPLRERGEDLEMLISYYLKRFNQELSREIQTISPEAMEILRRHNWPGNLRELQSVLKQALLQASGPVLLPHFLPPYLRTVGELAHKPASADGADWARFINERLQTGAVDLYAEALALMEKDLLTRVLQHVGGNQVHAAKILGIARNSLRTKMRAHKITLDK